MAGVWPISTPAAWLAGFMKRITYHWHTQNIRALGIMVPEKKIFLCVSYCKSKGDYDPRGVANFDPRGMIGRIYVGYH